MFKGHSILLDKPEKGARTGNVRPYTIHFLA